MSSRSMTRNLVLAAAGVLGLSMAAGVSQDQRADAGNTVPICHIDGQGRVRLINVNPSAVAAHKTNHGDYDQVTFYLDADGDGYGDGTTAVACEAPGDGYVTTGGDCNDGDAAVNPAAFDACEDGVDNDCNGGIDDQPFARILLHCDPGSEQILTLCGPGPHDISGNTFVNTNISYFDFGDGTTGANITKCRTGGGTPDTVSITGDTNLCLMFETYPNADCCQDPARYNDNVCVIELF
jgi:hypothetical protein